MVRHMIRRAFAFVLLSALLSAQTAPAPEPQEIVGRVFAGGRGMQYLTELTDTFGPRLTGSPNYDAAAEWAVRQFRAMGIQDVRLEPVQLAHTWKRGEGRGRILTPQERPLHIEQLGWSPPTPPGGVKGAVYVLDDVSPENIAGHASDIRNHVVVLNMRKVAAARRNSYAPYVNLFKAPELLQRAGAKGVLVAGSLPSAVLGTTAYGWDTSIAALPIAYIAMEDGEYIFRRAKSEQVTLEYSYTSEAGGPATVHSVVAEIKGREKPDEWILLGAHLDSWDLATGAQDNGAGSAQVLEAARILSSLEKRPSRSIRFALWAGEEEGLLGSRAYVKQHAAELARCVAVLNTDNGAGAVEGWKTEGRDDLEKALQPFADEYLAPLGAGKVSKELTYDTDHGPFMAIGVPALDMLVDMKAYMEVHHNAGDTLDKVKPANLNTGTAVLTITANHLANADAPLGRRLERAEVETILKTRQLDVFLKSLGDW